MKTLQQWIEENRRLCELWRKGSGLYAPSLGTRMEAQIEAGKTLPQALRIIEAAYELLQNENVSCLLDEQAEQIVNEKEPA